MPYYNNIKVGVKRMRSHFIIVIFFVISLNADEVEPFHSRPFRPFPSRTTIQSESITALRKELAEAKQATKVLGAMAVFLLKKAIEPSKDTSDFYDNAMKDRKCSICLDFLAAKSPIASPGDIAPVKVTILENCFHIICTSCRQQNRTPSQCPICRQKITKNHDFSFPAFDSSTFPAHSKDKVNAGTQTRICAALKSKKVQTIPVSPTFLRQDSDDSEG